MPCVSSWVCLANATPNSAPKKTYRAEAPQVCCTLLLVIVLNGIEGLLMLFLHVHALIIIRATTSSPFGDGVGSCAYIEEPIVTFYRTQGYRTQGYR